MHYIMAHYRTHELTLSKIKYDHFLIPIKWKATPV
jgi:hypothetical protein